MQGSPRLPSTRIADPTRTGLALALNLETQWPAYEHSHAVGGPGPRGFVIFRFPCGTPIIMDCCPLMRAT